MNDKSRNKTGKHARLMKKHFIIVIELQKIVDSV